MKLLGPRQTQAGFTLIEVLLYLAVSSFILFSVSSFVVASMRARAESQVIAEVEQQGERLMQVMAASVRSSRGINSPVVGASGASLSVFTTVPATNPTVFGLSSGNITITEGAGGAVALDNTLVTVSGLTFTNVSRPSTPGTIRIQFTLTYSNPAGGQEYQYSKVFYGTASVR